MMTIRFTIDVGVERESGKFASREEIVDEIQSWLDAANDGEIGGVGADGESVYTVTDWDVSEATS